MSFSCDSPLLQNKPGDKSRKTKNAIFLIIVALAVVGVTLGFVFARGSNWNGDSSTQHRAGAVVSNGIGCAEVGGKILMAGGSAVDAAIATMLCEGVVLPHSLGLGGGFIATMYTKETGKVETMVAREAAPAAAHQDMFIAKKITGAIAAAIPAEICGYWHMHLKYGRLPWKDLFEPSIKLCREGHVLTAYMANILLLHENRIRKEPSMAEIFINPHTNKLYQENETMYRLKLGETLQAIAEEGVAAIYGDGRIGEMLAKDIQEMGGFVTVQDLKNYNVRWEEPVVAQITGGYTLYTTPLPSSGVVLAFIINVMNTLYTENHDVYWQRLIETFKHAYGHRTNLGDLHFEPQVIEIIDKLLSPTYAAGIRPFIHDDRTITDPDYYGATFANEEDGGTANIAVLAQNGDAITVTSSVNNHFGAKVRSRRTGIILNDQMDDFSTPGVINTYGIPASPANFIQPGKRPMSSICPSIVMDKNGEIRLLIGGAGGSRITTSVAQVILRYLVFNHSMEEAINAGRIHHQLAPMHIDVEPEVKDHINAYLLSVGHELNYLPVDKAYSALTAIGLKTEEPVPICDYRRTGSTAIVYEQNQSTS